MAMDMLQDLGTTLTGSIHKALLFIKKPNTTTDNSSKLKESLLKKKSFREDPSGAFKSQLSESSKLAGNGYHVLQVKYNPSKLQMSTKAGCYTQSGPGGEGVNTITQITVPAQTILNVELVFDDMSIPDAFMWDKFTPSLDNAVTSTAGLIKKGKFDMEYSVRKQMDGLLGLISSASSKNVVFYWSEMAFVGQLTNVQARYTMFNPKGEPVRGSIRLSIFQNEDDSKSEDEYWNSAFTKLFGDYSVNGETDAGKMIDNISNLLQL